MQRAVQGVDQEADSPSALEQQITTNPWECDQSREQEDDFGAKEEEVEWQLQKLWEGNCLDQNQSQGVAAGNEQIER